MTLKDDGSKVVEEDCSSTRSDSHSETDTPNHNNLPEAVHSPAGPDHVDNKDSSNGGDNVANIYNDTVQVINSKKVCEWKNLRENKSDGNSKPFGTLQIRKKNLLSIHHNLNLTPTCVNIGNEGIPKKDDNDGINMESMPKKQRQEKLGIITNPETNADPKQLSSTNASSSILGDVEKDGIAPSVGSRSGDDIPKNIGTPTPCKNTSRTDAPVLELFAGQSSRSMKSRPSYIPYLDGSPESPPPSNNKNNINAKNLGPTTGQNTTSADAPVLELFEDDLLTKKRQMANPSSASRTDAPELKLFVGQSSRSMKSRPSYIPYLDGSPESPPPSNKNNINNPLPPDFEPMVMPNPPINNEGVLPPQDEGPGAYSATHGSRLRRLDQLNFSLVGVHPELSDHQAAMIQQQHDDGVNCEPVHMLELVEQPEQQLPNLDSSINHGALVQASRVSSSSFYNALRRMTAKPVNQLEMDQATAREAKEKKHKRIACGIVALACVVLMVSLAVRFNKKDDSTSTAQDNQTPTPSPTSPLPPMEHLELLYDELPENTKESLSNRDSPQYQAWEWVLNHPNISSYPEWRKKQVFAMATFFYSFEGENWPEQIQTRWLNVTTDECSWVLTDMEVAFFAKQSADILGDDYDLEDYRPCNVQGQLQTLLMHNLYLTTAITPVMPPEIGLLTTLRILAILSSQMGRKLSDLIVPELIELPNLLQLTFHATDVSGTIPVKTLGMLTGLRHLLLSDNQLTGSVPPEIGGMTSLEYLTLGMNSHTGQIPSHIGLLTRIRVLHVWANKLIGSLPSQLGLLTSMTWFASSYNVLTGTVPSELGLWTRLQSIWLRNNAIGGSIPTEFGLMSHLVELGLGNDVDGSGPNSQTVSSGPYTNFTGSIPRELWELSNMEKLVLPNLPNLRGRIPSGIFMPNLTMLRVEGSPLLMGTIPDQACSFPHDLDFDCSDILCGCDCPCAGSANGTNSKG